MKEVKIKSPDIQLVTDVTVNDLVEVELIRNTLKDHEFDSELDGELRGGFTGALGIDVIVRKADVEAASEIIKSHHPQQSPEFTFD